MTAAATADRIVAGSIVSTDMKIRGGNEELRANLANRTVPVVVADNVAAYVGEQGEKGRVYAIGAWPCLAPPWDWAFIEYPNATGRQRRGVYMLGFDLATATPDELAELTGMIGAAIDDARHQSPGEEVRWALVMCVFVDDGHRVAGPMGSVISALDEYGKELGNRWFLRPESRWKPATDDEAMWLHAALLPALQTIAFGFKTNHIYRMQTAGDEEKGRPPAWRTSTTARGFPDLLGATARVDAGDRGQVGEGLRGGCSAGVAGVVRDAAVLSGLDSATQGRPGGVDALDAPPRRGAPSAWVGAGASGGGAGPDGPQGGTAPMTHLHADEWEVLVVPDHAEAVDFVRRFHYAGGASNTSTYRHGLYRRDEAHGPLRGPLRGVAMWQPPTKAAALSVAPGDWRRVLSLSRFAVDEDVPTNGASFLLGGSMRAISRYRWRVLLTYADTGEGHTGAIYRATNWTCLGPVAAGDTWVDVCGVQRGRKRGGHTLTAAEMVAAGFTRRLAAPKIKFVHVARSRVSLPRLA